MAATTSFRCGFRRLTVKIEPGTENHCTLRAGMSLRDQQTQYQSDEDRLRSQELSLKSSQPPAKVPGYTLEQFLGAGAYGEVWSGTEKKTGRRVAVKYYTRKTSDDVQMLAREVEKLIALSADRYVVQLVDVDWTATPPYFIMDYFEHGSLEDLLKSENALPVSHAEDLFSELATGLMHLHGKGIFHCDLKPGNVLLDQDGKPRLADFGQARLGTDKTPSLGTLFFMAPEQADLDAVPAAKWDVYALGAIMYSMLVGKPPYHSEELTERIESSTTIAERLEAYNKTLRSAPKPTLHRNVPGVDRALADIIDRALDANPNNRFDSIQSVMFAMRQRELAKARQPLLVLGLLGPLLLLTVMSVFAWFAYNRAYSDTQVAVTEKAKDSNRFAAQLAAKSAATKIEEYVRVVWELARNKEFIEDFQTAINDPELQELAQQLDDPAHNSDPDFEQFRLDYRANAARQKLQKYLKFRIDKAKTGRYPECASWFINDLRGNQVASVFQAQPDNITIGRNYSWRTYFTGEIRDRRIDDVELWGTPRKIVDHAHMSAIFLSKGTSTWKVAFSVPIRRQISENESEIIGIVACTSEMGHFVDFLSERHQYATLIDGRKGDNQGAILEHPIFHVTSTNPKDIPRVMDFPEIQKTERFEDPVAKLPGGDAWDREWLAAIRPVIAQGDSYGHHETTLAGIDPNENHTGLYVLVAEDYGEIAQPVFDLGQNLIWLAIYATVFFLTVALAMWLLVFRMLKMSNANLARSFNLSSDSTYRTNFETGKTP